MKNKGKGFSLTELMITLTIAGVVAAFVVPSFYGSIRNNRITTNINELVTSLNLARSEAAKRGRRVTVCKSADGQTCTGTGGWEQGWVVFVDKNSNAQVDSTNNPATNEEIILRHDALPEGSKLTGNQSVEKYVSFVAGGFTQTVGGGIQMGSLILCDERKDTTKAKAITINQTGRLRIVAGPASTMQCQ